MNRSEVLKIDSVFDELEDVHLYEPGIVLSAPNEAAVVDRRKVFDPVRWLGRGTITCSVMPMVDQHPSMKLLDRPGPGAMPGV